MGKIIQKRISKWPINMENEVFNLISFLRNENENPVRYCYTLYPPNGYNLNYWGNTVSMRMSNT